MANENFRFPVRKAYKKVERNNISTNSSCSRHDVLSYSYSCIQAFKNNQNIIGNLAVLNNNAKYQGIAHEPALFSLSGERENRINQLYHNNSGAVSEKTEQKYNCIAQRFSTNSFQSSTNFQYKSESSFCDKNQLFQWFKYQLKYINSIWPLYKSGVSCLSKICSKKDQQMKMEMLLNDVDEEIKYKLKKFVNELNLNLKESYNVSNESVIEIDVTPIMHDTNRFQSFIQFLQNLEPNNSKVVEESSILFHQQCCKFSQNEVELNKNTPANPIIENNNLFQTNKSSSANYRKVINRSGDTDFNNHKTKINLNHRPLKLTLESLHHPPDMKTCNCYEEHYSINYPSKNDQCKQYWTARGNTLTIGQEKHQIQKLLCQNNKSPLGSNVYSVRLQSNQDEEKREKLKTNLPSKLKTGAIESLANEEATYSNKKQLFIQDVTHAEAGPTHYQKGNYSFCDTNSCKLPPCIDNTSCKCLMHQNREDYNRYKNQCLFGQGDEKTSSLIKYITLKEEKSKTKINSVEIPTRDIPHKLENNEQDSFCSGKPMRKQKRVKNRILTTQPQIKNTRKNKNHSNIIKHISYESNLALKNVLDDSKRDEADYSVTKSKFANNELSQKTDNSTVKNNSAEECNSNERYLESKKYKVVSVEDVEELVCEINYSDSNISTGSSNQGDTNSSNCIKKKHSSDDLNYKKISINACFESLNYSLNSFPSNSSSKTSNSTSLVQENSRTANQRKKISDTDNSSDSVISCYPVFIELPYKNNNVIDNKCEKKLTKIQTEKEISQNGYNLKYTKGDEKNNHGEYFCCKRGCKNKNNLRNKQNENSINYPFIYDSQETVLSDKKQNKIKILLQNNNDLKAKITDLNKNRTSILNRKEHEVSNEQKCSTNIDIAHDSDSGQSCSSNKKMSMVIQITDNESQLNNENPSRSNKIQSKLHFLKPKYVYSNISSVFKRRGEILQNYKSKEGIKSSAEEIKSSSLILNNLEKMFSELRQQREDINSMKKLLHKCNR